MKSLTNVLIIKPQFAAAAFLNLALQAADPALSYCKVSSISRCSSTWWLSIYGLDAAVTMWATAAKICAALKIPKQDPAVVKMITNELDIVWPGRQATVFLCSLMKSITQHRKTLKCHMLCKNLKERNPFGIY